MINKQLPDNTALQEHSAVFPMATSGVMKSGTTMSIPANVAKYGDSSLPFSGIIYRRWLDKPDCDDNGKSYIGETMDEATRNSSWRKPNSKEYAGSKIVSARDEYGLACWGYEVLEVVYAGSENELKLLLYERETFYIAKFDSYDNGFNSNRGGTGNKGVVFDDARRKQNGDNRRGKPQSAATKDILRQKSTGRKKSVDERAKISKGNKGKKRTDEMRMAQSQRMKGNEPKAATLGAKKWREKNGGGSWKGKKIPVTAMTKRNETRRKTSQRIRVTAKDGKVVCYLCQTDAAKATGLKDGSVYYALKRPDGMHFKSRYKFEKISDSEFQAWKASNSKN
ncbi:MAG: hypothetical protein ACI3ZD_00095 [Prevotella sp.]